MSAVTAGIAAGLLLPAVGQAATPDVAVATSTGGLVAKFTSLGPNDMLQTGVLVVPGGTTTVAQPQVGSADFAKPWAVFKDGPYGSTAEITCYVVTNPSSWSAGEPVFGPMFPYAVPPPGTPRPLDGVSFDAACPDDRSGFQHYRVRFTDRRDPHSGKPWAVFQTNGADDRGAAWIQGPGVNGGLTHTVEQSTTSDYVIVYVKGGWTEAATVRVCGFSASRSKCWDGDGSVWIDPQLITATVG